MAVSVLGNGLARLAAVAQAAGMTVVTRNTRHVEPLGVTCVDPWDPDPA